MITDRDHDFLANESVVRLSRGGSVRIVTRCMDMIDPRSGCIYYRMAVDHSVDGDVTPEEADELLHWVMCCGSAPMPDWCK